MEALSIELVQVVEVVAAIAATEHINLILVAVSSVHVAWTRRYARILVCEPLKFLEIQNMHVICSEWTLAEPAANNIKLIS